MATGHTQQGVKTTNPIPPARAAAPLVPVAQPQQPKAEEPKKEVGAIALLRQQRGPIGECLIGDFSGNDGKRRRNAAIDRVIRVVGLELSKPLSRLPACNPWTIVASVQESLRLNLEIGGAMGEAYLVPYGNVCQLQAGYRGLIKLAERSDKIKSVQAHVVYVGDRFRYQLGDEPKIEHEPKIDRDPKAKWTHAYSVIVKVGGGKLLDVMSNAEVMKIKARSKAAQKDPTSPWHSDETEMARKTVCRRNLKYAPMSVEAAEILDREDQSNTIDGDATEINEVPPGNAGLMGLGRAQLSSGAAPSPVSNEPPPPSDADFSGDPDATEKAEILAAEKAEADKHRG